VADQTPVVAEDHLGLIHRLWPVTDVSVISAVASAVGPKPVFVADGHHRYETACEYRDHVYQSGFLSEDHPANFVLMMLVAMEDPGLIVLPCHRLFTGVPDLSSSELAAKLDGHFTTQDAGEGPEQIPAIWEEIETGDDQETLALFTRKDQRWMLARLNDAGRQRMAEVAEDHTEEWRHLGVSILHRLIVKNLLGVTDLPKPKFVNWVDEVASGIDSGRYPLAAMVMPAGVDHIRTISLGGERMPSKSTYFYPKLLSGLVVNPLE
jgi:uncharacterized protein (DUF1015 family)